MYWILQLLRLMKCDVNVGSWEKKDSVKRSFTEMLVCGGTKILRVKAKKKPLNIRDGSLSTEQAVRLDHYTTSYRKKGCGTVCLKTVVVHATSRHI